MRVSPIIKLKNNLLDDTDYIYYEEIYNKENVIDRDWIVNTFLDNFYKDSCKRYWAGVW